MNESPLLYDYAADDTGVWDFPVGAANPSKVWQSGRGNWTWGKSKLAAGVLRGEAGTEAVREICALYDYSNDDTGLWVLPTDGSNPVKVWQSGRGNWAWGKSKVIGADIRGIGYPEVCVLYDYGNDGSGLFVFPAGEASPSPADLGRWQDARGQ